MEAALWKQHTLGAKYIHEQTVSIVRSNNMVRLVVRLMLLPVRLAVFALKIVTLPLLWRRRQRRLVDVKRLFAHAAA